MSETPTESDTPPSAAAPAGRPPRPKKQDEPQGLWKGWLRPFLIVILIVTALRSSLVDWNDVPTGSMRHTIAVGDRIVVNKLSYGFNPPFNGPKISIPFVGVEFTSATTSSPSGSPAPRSSCLTNTSAAAPTSSRPATWPPSTTAAPA